MDNFIVYLCKIGSRKINYVNILKRINDVMTNNTKHYDNFDYLITNKFKVTTWMFNNLKCSTINVYAIAIRHAIDSMNIEENKKKENICFYLKIASKCKIVSDFCKLTNVKKKKIIKTKETLNDLYAIIINNHSFVINFANINNFKKMKAIDEILSIFNS